MIWAIQAIFSSFRGTKCRCDFLLSNRVFTFQSLLKETQSVITASKENYFQTIPPKIYDWATFWGTSGQPPASRSRLLVDSLTKIPPKTPKTRRKKKLP